MGISYKRLWKLLIDKNINKGELCKIAQISTASITKMGHGGFVSTKIIERICIGLNCKAEDVFEIIPSEENYNELGPF